jgi:hypothetical protein
MISTTGQRVVVNGLRADGRGWGEIDLRTHLPERLD